MNHVHHRLLLAIATLCILIAAPGTHASVLTSDESWVNQESAPWTVNVAGVWHLQLCSPPAPLSGSAKMADADNIISVTVQQEGQRIHAGNAQDGVRLEGTVHGHSVSFTALGIEQPHCTTGKSRLKFTGDAKGAFITGQFSSLPDSKTATAAFTVQLRREFMLTFDDGPLPEKTDRVLDTLARFQTEDGKPVRAAFFMLSDAPESFWTSRTFYAPYEIWTHKGSMKKYPELVNRVKNEGHWIGNHSAHHAWFHWPWLSSTASISDELSAWEKTHAELADDQPKLFRPPYLINSQAVQAAAAKLNYRIVAGRTVGDAAPGSNVESVKKNILRTMETWDQPTPVILILHDIFPVTYRHLDEIILYLKNKGYVLVNFR